MEILYYNIPKAIFYLLKGDYIPDLNNNPKPYILNPMFYVLQGGYRSYGLGSRVLGEGKGMTTQT